MQVLRSWSDAHRETSVDVFVNEPFPFDDEYAPALVKPLRATLPVRFVSRDTLIRMKQEAGRPRDQVLLGQNPVRQCLWGWAKSACQSFGPAVKWRILGMVADPVA